MSIRFERGNRSFACHLHAALALQVGHGALEVPAELVLKEDLVELLELTKFQHRLQFGFHNGAGTSCVRLVLEITSELARFTLALEIVLRGQSMLHELNFEGVDLLAGVEDGFKFEPYDLISDVVKVLGLCHVNVVLQETLHNLLLLLWDSGLIDILNRLLKVRVEVFLEILLLVDQRGVPVVLDRVVATTKEHVGDLGPAILNGLMENVEDPVFLNGPVGFFEKRVELVMPTLTALFTGSLLHLESHLFPLEGSDLSDHIEKFQVLFVVPGAFAGLVHNLRLKNRRLRNIQENT